MKIYLFLNDKIMHFLLPKEPLGSFSFGTSSDEESKIINIDAIDSQWYIYSTSDVKLIQNNTEIDKLPIESGNFYVLKRDSITYLVYVTNIKDNNVGIYNYSKDINLIIGKSTNCGIIYNHESIPDMVAYIHFVGDKLQLDINGLVYVNNVFLNSKQYEIVYGDQINIYGLTLIVLNNIIIIIGDKRTTINNLDLSKLVKKDIKNEKIEDFEIKDVNLYSKNDYYSKSPRIRRIIEKQTYKLSKPPKIDSQDELPLILTIGPIFTMGIATVITLSQSISKLMSHETNISSEWPKLATSGAMIISMIMWPLITKMYSKKSLKRKRKNLEIKYGNYLSERKQDLLEQVKFQKDVLLENLLSTMQCLNIITKQGYNFWDKRNDQDDFLQVRVGIGTAPLEVDIKYDDDDFTIEEDALKKQADRLIDEFKYIYNVPVKYSFYQNRITAICGNTNKCHVFMNNLIIQLITFYTYEDLKFVVFTNKNNMHYWEYLKYLNHNFSNSKDIRFFSSEVDYAKSLCEYFDIIASKRAIEQGDSTKAKTPHYIVIIDDYNSVKNFDFIKKITESEDDLGFSVVLLEERLSELPSKCNNFISIGIKSECDIIQNTYEKQTRLEFVEEIIYNLDMMSIARKLSNIPIEFENGNNSLPNSLSFLEMEKVGKIEQLNILNRWNTNDSTISLKSEVGVDEAGNLIYLDLHEKAHGPHGLIAGTTGSGKSEFIITYILSMCINFSPDIVSFVLIDYKGGGLALAFENKTAGIYLPHLAGTITNLDKAEMDRTLVSIESEVKRRQKIFNEAREQLGESTIDIYKYQRFYKEGRLQEPVPHLFIVCDEFAELKSQHPEFMDNLISVARIGRSLGVHLILATQKPTGVVSDQIWSNSRFKVCLKVQDENDSKELLKKPDAAYLKQAGRFYLQVGFDEYYILGQSGWCGAKYYPSDKIIKEVDKSINFINDCGIHIKSIKASTNHKIEAQGEQFGSILNAIIEISDKVGKKSRKLWLDNINQVILVDEIKNKYNVEIKPYNVEAILGEYDAPEIQYQGIVKYNFIEQGNTLIYGNNGSENEMLLDALIYSSCNYHSASEINFYIVDYGSESLRKYEKLPHVGGIVYAADEEKFNNLLKLIQNQIKQRKKIFSEYGGEYKNYIKTNKLPILAVILNNYDSILESNKNFYDEVPDLVRDSERYGIVFIVTCNTVSSVPNKVSSSFSNVYSYKLKDPGDYMSVFGSKTRVSLRDTLGRGFVKDSSVHEFQTASIVSDVDKLPEYIDGFVKYQKSVNKYIPVSIPTLPDNVRLDNVSSKIDNIRNIPVGISKESLEINTFDFLQDLGSIISSNRLQNTEYFVKSLITILKTTKNVELFVIDPMNNLKYSKDELNNYFVNDLDSVINKFIEYFDRLINDKIKVNGLIIIYGIGKFIDKIENKPNFEKVVSKIKEYENIGMLIIDDSQKIKNYLFDAWFKNIFNVNNGIWIGKGITDQSLFHVTAINKEMTKEIPNNMGYIINESSVNLCKLIDFYTKDE